MTKYALAYLTVCLLLCIAGAGCMTQEEKGTNIQCEGQDPIIGAWQYEPAAESPAVFLYLFKVDHQYITVALPRDEAKPLTYGLLVTGTWIAATEHTYNLSGQILIHDVITDDLVEAVNDETLTYDQTSDTLFNEMQPEARFTRLSCVPEVPKGMDVTIPFG